MGPDHLDIDRVLAETFVSRAEHHAVIGSTNDRAKELAAAGRGELPLLVAADEQTAGRGRGAHRWWTGPGSLAFSLLMDGAALTTNGTTSPLVGLAAAVAVAEGIAPLLPAYAVGLHWPNDVVSAGRKLAGVLVETLADRRHVVGIGLNLNNTLDEAPAELRETATTLLELTRRRHNRTEVLVCLLQGLEAVFAHLAAEPQQVALRADALCLQHGKLLRLEHGNQLLIGHCAGIAPDGALLLETSTGRRAVYSGRISQSPIPNPQFRSPTIARRCRPVSYRCIKVTQRGVTVMPEPRDHADHRPVIESILRQIPGFRGYLEKEYRRESDELQRRWLADRLQRSKRAVSELSLLLADAAQVDLLPQIDRLRARLDRLIGRIRGAMQGYSGFFDLVQVDEHLLNQVYEYDTALMEQVEALAKAVEELPGQPDRVASALPDLVRRVDEVEGQWDLREDMLKGLA